MSVIVTLRMKADPAKLESIAREDPDRLRGIADKARHHGVIAHRFYGADDGQIMVADEWPDAHSFEAFFEGSRGEIEPVMAEVGVAGEPEVTVWRRLETGDEIGWTG